MPVVPFPQWLRCTACDELAPVDVEHVRRSTTTSPHRPARGAVLPRRLPASAQRAGRSRWRPASCSPASAGHLDDFPYRHFVHQAAPCPEAEHPRLRMQDRGGNLGANVEIRCVSCRGQAQHPARRWASAAEQNLPALPGTPPAPAHLRPRRLRRSSPSCWSSARPTSGSRRRCPRWPCRRRGRASWRRRSSEHWEQLEGFPTQRARCSPAVPCPLLLRASARGPTTSCGPRSRRTGRRWPARATRARPSEGYLDLRTAGVGDLLRRPPSGRPRRTSPCAGRAIAPDAVGLLRRRRAGRAAARGPRARRVHPAGRARPRGPRRSSRSGPAGRSRTPTWVPASEVRGEGIFLRLAEDLLPAWEQRGRRLATALQAHRDAYARFRQQPLLRPHHRPPSTPMAYWPGARYIALHTLSHLLIRTIALECGYSSASLSERIYAGHRGRPAQRHPHLHRRPRRRGHPRRAGVARRAARRCSRLVRRALHDAAALLVRPAVRRAAAAAPRRLPARRGLPRLPVRLRDHLRARQPVPRPAVRRPYRRRPSGRSTDLP